ncbi:universal stress protein [Roseibium algae]|uniref:Universal stress protein n=1 Tax=Roseibium algae TaxID=3123038 RepID=A0ABU8TI64_9HYPH
MMTINFVVGFDGSKASEAAVRFAVKQAQTCDATLIIAHVLEWSPYSFLTPTEIEERHARRNMELKRAKEALIDPLLEKIKSEVGAVESVIRYGNIVDTIIAISKDSDAAQIFIGRTGHRGVASRVFGSVAGSLAQHASVPVTIIP